MGKQLNAKQQEVLNLRIADPLISQELAYQTVYGCNATNAAKGAWRLSKNALFRSKLDEALARSQEKAEMKRQDLLSLWAQIARKCEAGMADGKTKVTIREGLEASKLLAQEAGMLQDGNNKQPPSVTINILQSMSDVC